MSLFPAFALVIAPQSLFFPFSCACPLNRSCPRSCPCPCPCPASCVSVPVSCPLPVLVCVLAPVFIPLCRLVPKHQYHLTPMLFLLSFPRIFPHPSPHAPTFGTSGQIPPPPPPSYSGWVWRHGPQISPSRRPLCFTLKFLTPPRRQEKTHHEDGAYLKCTEHTRHSALRLGGQVRGSLLWRRWGRPCLRASVRDVNQRTVRTPER